MMSIVEIKESIDAMPRDERAFLEAYLKAKNLTEDAAFSQQAAEGLAAMQQGDALTSAQVKELHEALSLKGL